MLFPVVAGNECIEEDTCEHCVNPCAARGGLVSNLFLENPLAGISHTRWWLCPRGFAKECLVVCRKRLGKFSDFVSIGFYGRRLAVGRRRGPQFVWRGSQWFPFR